MGQGEREKAWDRERGGRGRVAIDRAEVATDSIRAISNQLSLNGMDGDLSMALGNTVNRCGRAVGTMHL